MNVQTVVAPQTGLTRLAIRGTSLVPYIAGGVLALHLATGWRYGHFGDELYFLACGEHLDWGYVDQPPLIALAAWLTRHLLGTSVFAVHVIPALAAAAIVWVTGLLAREMGGSRFAQALAALCTACAGVYLAMGHLFTMNVFEPLFWMGCAWLVLRVINTGNDRLWLWFGVLAGVGLENKYSMAFFAIALIVGVALTRHRGQLLSKWFWMGALIALLIFAPNLLWNIRHHWPFFELMHNIRASGRDVVLSPTAYVVAQIMQMNPATFLVWLPGCLWLFFARKGSAYRALGWAFIVLLGIMIGLHGKDYYAAPVYGMLFAAGAIAIDDAARNRWLGWLRFAVPGLILALAILILPLVVPVLRVEQFARYWAGVNRVVHLQPQEKSMFAEPLPHIYSFSFGWDELVRATSRAYNSVPPAERADTAIYASNFASAGAIDLLGPQYGLPKAISGHQNYWLWGPRQYSGQTVILVSIPVGRARAWFDEVTPVAEVHSPYAPPWLNQPILLCRKPRLYRTLSEGWPTLKTWD
jgi:hypothetical protein